MIFFMIIPNIVKNNLVHQVKHKKASCPVIYISLSVRDPELHELYIEPFTINSVKCGFAIHTSHSVAIAVGVQKSRKMLRLHHAHNKQQSLHYVI